MSVDLIGWRAGWLVVSFLRLAGLCVGVLGLLFGVHAWLGWFFLAVYLVDRSIAPVLGWFTVCLTSFLMMWLVECPICSSIC